MNKNFMTMLCSGIMMAMGLLPQVIQEKAAEAAVYQSDSDTHAEILDYIEHRDRIARENIVTDEQKQLLDDAYKMRQELRNPLDPTKNVPIAIEGEDMFYDQATGDVVVNGNVQLTTLDSRRLKTEELTGNIKESTVDVEGKARLLQMTPDQMRIILTGYKTQYDYTRGLGKMEEAHGKAGNKYIKAKRVELYPDLIVIYEGHATKCSSEHPDYRMQAERIEIYPDGRMIAYKVKYYLGNIVVYQSSKEVVDPNKESMPHMPKAGYKNSDGIWISDSASYNIADRVNADINGTYYTKKGLKADGGISWDTKAMGTFRVYTGMFEDSNNIWVRKGPTLKYNYAHRIADSHFHWSLEYEHGIWHQNNVHASHISYKVGLSMDPIRMGTWSFSPSTSYSIVDESGNVGSQHVETRSTGFDYNLLFFKEYDMKWANYFEYAYSQSNSTNRMIDFDTDSFSRKFNFGLSYRMDNRNRFVVGCKWDLDDRRVADIDYYWFYQLHCAELITRYRAKRHSWSVSFQFTPW